MIVTIFYNLIITPLIYLFEVIFSLVYRVFQNPGLAIIAVSLTMNLLCLPLYKRADAIQDEQKEKQKSMSRWTDHIRKTFKGDERFMMLQAYYKEQHYSPMSVLKSSVSLFLQIPFFIAAYRYLSTLELLNGQSFLIFTDLSKPDGLMM